jgi:hypothetical protein
MTECTLCGSPRKAIGGRAAAINRGGVVRAGSEVLTRAPLYSTGRKVSS